MHATVYGVSEFPACLVLMSITKDAERIGDDVEEHPRPRDLSGRKPKGSPYYDQLLELKTRISRCSTETRELYEAAGRERAPRPSSRSAEVLKDECDDAVEEILRAHEPRERRAGGPASTALCFRYYKRVISHARNIVTSIVVPVDRLDYFDESKDTRDGDPPV